MTPSDSPVRPNRLSRETSPYLLQHAHNPVDWYAWSPEALAAARAADRPILLSVGYSACHWCHVMAHESFEDPETAALMNRWFVNIKVDREERPDIDAIYMEAVQSLTGQGGWPMTVFLTPDGRPFYGGTYFPPEPRYGMPSFREVLAAVAEAWRARRQDLETAAAHIGEALSQSSALAPSAAPVEPELLERAAGNLLRTLDRREGGFGGAPKFPQPMTLDFLLARYRQTHDQELLDAVTLTLSKMARGGMYDQLGGGFHRYSTDARWLVPHFEKMLYDNAQLARTYLHAWQITGEPEFRAVVEGTLDYVLREMTSPEGGFYSTEDADSEGEEGKYYLWTQAEVAGLLGEDAPLFAAYYDITPEGNFHEGGPGRNILHVARALDDVAAERGVAPSRLSDALVRGRVALLTARAGRVRPGQDQKILAEWNGLMLHALAEAGAALDRADYVAAAGRAAEFLRDKMAAKDDGGVRLYRSYKDGRARLPAYLEDYASVALGLLGLYEATLELRWLEAAAGLAEVILALFADGERPGFFQTSIEHEELVARRKDFVDNAVPSGNSLAAELYLRLGKLLEHPAYTAHATGIMQGLSHAMGEQPAAFGRLLSGAAFHLDPGFEIAVIGDPAAEDAALLLAEIWRRYLPNSVWALARPGDEAAPGLVPFLAARPQLNGEATAYVCQNYVCRLPVTRAAALVEQLGP